MENNMITSGDRVVKRPTSGVYKSKMCTIIQILHYKGFILVPCMVHAATQANTKLL